MRMVRGETAVMMGDCLSRGIAEELEDFQLGFSTREHATRLIGWPTAQATLRNAVKPEQNGRKS
ncbi:hypothetical protein CYJ10_33590 [Cupriavidus pauculus]|uniref:Uncharacterized protein n=1 Tax=Cupriavidus pauculus TaxID=82633 RepID=A0A2N5C1W3_9BURK|nr:hypothetical protein CYJ10_33590 [Cupriavidus pauculus]